jgi:hypothetical protein
MSDRMKASLRIIALLAFVAVLVSCSKSNTTPAGPPASRIAERTKEQNTELGRQHKTAAELYQALHDEAKGGQRLAPAGIPDWTGIYTRPAINGFTFDPEQPEGGLPTAKLTPEYQKKMLKRIDDVKHGIEWDPISTCSPPGMPRWLTEPFLREFIVTPDQTWLINEMVNDVRRVYTDGREHIAEADRTPIPDGDSIGFWDGSKLVIHTNQLQSGIYQRSNPDYTDKVETVEIWQKKDDKTMGVDVWVYDPPALAEPWYVRQNYLKVSDPDKTNRIRYWNCGENPNNSVFQTQDGTTQFKNLNFDSKASKEKGKP